MILPPSAHALRLVRSSLGWQPGTAKFEPVSSGRHLRVFKVTCPGSAPVALKEYAPDYRETQSLARDFSALRLLPRFDIPNVPKALHQDADRGVAIYEWLEGSAISPTERGEDVFDPLLEFLVALRKIPLGEFPDWASASVRSGSVLESRLRRRFAALPREHAHLQEWLAASLEPVLEEFLQASRSACETFGGWEQEIAEPLRLLAPSHLGFDDILESPSRQILLVNFGGFGQDDPASILARLLAQSLETTSPDQKARLVSGFFARFGGDPSLGTRFSAWFPLVGLEHVLDLLAPFAILDRPLREFAGLPLHPKEETLLASRSKAERALANLRHEVSRA